MQPADKMLLQGYRKLDNGNLVFNDIQLRVNAYETIGKRDAQEDAMTINEVPGFATLADDQQRRVLLHTYDEINQKLKSQSDLKVISTGDTGATAITCISYVTKKNDKIIINIVSANLADNSAYYFIRNKSTGKIRRCARINKNLHKPSDPNETIRITLAGGYVRDNRVDGKSAVARAFGDFDFSNKVIHTPDINSLSIELNKGEELLLIAACDGLTENRLVAGGKDHKFIARTDVVDAESGSEILALKILIEQECANLDYDQLPAKLKEWATNINYSRDNITVIVQSIDADSKEPILQHAILLAVFDGHTSAAVAEFVKNTFYNELIKQIQNKYKPQPVARNATLKMPPLTDSDMLDESSNIETEPPILPKPSRAVAQPAPAIIKADKNVNPPVISASSVSAETTKVADNNRPSVFSDPARPVAQKEAINNMPSEAGKDNIWLTKEIIIQIKKDYEAKFNAKIFKRTSVESKQLLDNLKESDSLEANQQRINAYLANEKNKNKRLYEILIENRIYAQIALAIKSGEPEMFSPHVERSWLNNTTIEDICFLIDKQYSHARGFKFFGYTSKESFELLERLRKPSLSNQDKEDKKREIENYLVNHEDDDTRLYNIITALFNKLHKQYAAALYYHSSHVLAT